MYYVYAYTHIHEIYIRTVYMYVYVYLSWNIRNDVSVRRRAWNRQRSMQAYTIRITRIQTQGPIHRHRLRLSIVRVSVQVYTSCFHGTGPPLPCFSSTNCYGRVCLCVCVSACLSPHFIIIISFKIFLFLLFFFFSVRLFLKSRFSFVFVLFLYIY